MSEHDQREDYDDDPNRGALAPAHIVLWPSSIMWAFGLLQLNFAQLAAAFLIVLVILSILDGHTSLTESLQEMTKPDGLLVIILWLATTAGCIIVIRGSNDLRRFRRYP